MIPKRSVTDAGRPSHPHVTINPLTLLRYARGFSAHPLGFVGGRFALMEARLLLATLAQRFRLSLVPGHPVAKHVAVTVSPKHGMKMRVQRR